MEIKGGTRKSEFLEQDLMTNREEVHLLQRNLKEQTQKTSDLYYELKGKKDYSSLLGSKVS